MIGLLHRSAHKLPAILSGGGRKLNLLQQATRMASTSSSSAVAGAGSRTYNDAIDCLNTLQSNAATINQVRATGGKLDKFAIPEMIDYVRRVGYSPEDLNALNVLHVTGTKGKGSTSAFVSSILTTLAPNAKVGLYTSPHMVAVRERIRINGKPLEEEKFAKYFFEVWDSFERNKECLFEHTTEKPAYFRYLTAMAFHVFLQEKVDATILEVGIGGTYDSTNIVPQPITTGITALGLDHTAVLGKTIEEIAHQKGGIYKSGVPALTVPQPPSAHQVVRTRAAELGASTFNTVSEHPQISHIKLGLAGQHQRSNASLAIALVQSFLSSPRLPSAFQSHRLLAEPQSAHDEKDAALGLKALPRSVIAPPELSLAMVQGLQSARWPGRCQIVEDRIPERRGVRWFLDGAHTVESLVCCGEWFVDEAVVGLQDSDRRRALIFNCTSGRSAEALLASLRDAMKSRTEERRDTSPGATPLFHSVIFCTNVTYSSGDYKGDLSSKAVDQAELDTLAVQKELASAWKKLAGGATAATAGQKSHETTPVHVLPSIEDAVRVIEDLNDNTCIDVDVLVTGSLHLIGGIFEVAKLDFAL